MTQETSSIISVTAEIRMQDNRHTESLHGIFTTQNQQLTLAVKIINNNENKKWDTKEE